MRNSFALLFAGLMVSLGLTAACGDHGTDLSAEPPTQTGKKSSALQFTSGANDFGLTGTIEAYPDANADDACTFADDVDGQTPVASEDVTFDEDVDIEAFGLEDGVYCFYVVDPGYTLYYDSDSNNDPDTAVDSDQVEITNNPAGPATITAGVVTGSPVVFDVVWQEELNATFGVTEVGFEVTADCPSGCASGEICGTMNSTVPGTSACYEICLINADCSSNLCVRGSDVNTQIDDAGLGSSGSDGVCVTL